MARRTRAYLIKVDKGFSEFKCLRCGQVTKIPSIHMVMMLKRCKCGGVVLETTPRKKKVRKHKTI